MSSRNPLRVFGSKNGEIETDCDDKDGRIALMIAARNGDEGAVRNILQERATVNSMTFRVGPMKQLITAMGNQHFFNENLPPDGPTRTRAVAGVRGRTPLTCAVQSGNVAVVRLLVESGEDVNEADADDGKTALHWAAEDGQVEIAELLLQMGADVEARYMSKTALHLAVHHAKLEMVKLLLAHNAGIESRDHLQGTPLHYAVLLSDTARFAMARIVNRLMGAESSDRRRIVELLLDNNADPLARGSTQQWTTRGVAIGNGDTEVLKLLLDRGGDNDEGTARMPLLCFAAWQRQEAVVQFLIERGVSIHGTDGRYGRNALSWAASRGNEAVFDRLLSIPGIGCNYADRMGRTAIFYATLAGNEVFFRQLRSRGGDVHQRDRFGLTPLFTAVQRGHTNLVRLILSKQPLEQEPDDRFGRSLSWWMQETGNTQIRDLLTGYGMKLEDSREKHDTATRHSSGSCDVCTLSLSRENRGVECGSGCMKYRICHVCCEFGASGADFPEIETQNK